MRPGRKHRTSKTLGIVLVVGVIAAGTYAFTAGNTVPASRAGDGTGLVSGYTVGSLDYNETSATDTDPSTIESVDFTLTGDADRVKAQLVAGGTWYACTKNALGTVLDASLAVISTSWECNTPGATATAVNQFRVLAYEDNNDV